jgi:hypothetical protein
MANLLKTYMYDELLSISSIIFVGGWHYHSAYRGGACVWEVHLIPGMVTPSFRSCQEKHSPMY